MPPVSLKIKTLKMKKHLLMGLVFLSLTACTRKLSDKTTTTETVVSANKKSYTYSTVTEPYSGNYFDSCRKENIILTGTVIYTIKESSYNGYHLSYDIDLKARGVGELSGVTFHGGTRQTATVKEDLAGNTKATINYKLKFVSDNGAQINFTQIVKFVFIDGETKLFFNNISASCK